MAGYSETRPRRLGQAMEVGAALQRVHAAIERHVGAPNRRDARAAI